MKAEDTLIVIPARLGSTRFPRKVLQNLGGVPIVEWCRRAAVRSRSGIVVVATDDETVRKTVESYGGTAVMTRSRLRSGTDRVHAAMKAVEKKTGWRFETIVNLQGDEPFIPPATIRKVIDLVRNIGGADMSTAVVPMAGGRDGKDPNVVKTAMAQDGRCLYFSRSPIPYGRKRKATLLRHIGIYGFTRSALERFVRLRPSVLEGIESLEQLRALEAGMTIRGARVKGPALAIDTPADLRRARKMLGRRRAVKRKK